MRGEEKEEVKWGEENLGRKGRGYQRRRDGSEGEKREGRTK